MHVGGHLETRRGDAHHRAVLSEERRHRDGNVRASGKDEGVGGARARTRRMYANSAASSSLRRGGDVCDVSMDRTIFASAPRAAISEGGVTSRHRRPHSWQHEIAVCVSAQVSCVAFLRAYNHLPGLPRDDDARRLELGELLILA